MSIPGRIHNGVVVFEGPVSLAEGAAVLVTVVEAPASGLTVRRPVVLPIFPYDGPADIELTNERIGEILDQEDAAS